MVSPPVVVATTTGHGTRVDCAPPRLLKIVNEFVSAFGALFVTKMMKLLEPQVSARSEPGGLNVRGALLYCVVVVLVVIGFGSVYAAGSSIGVPFGQPSHCPVGVDPP